MASADKTSWSDLSLPELAARAERCTACDLYLDANQVVFGEGPAPSPLMLLGEQPGDQEDLEGEPFVGPSGRELDRALEAAGIDRAAVYVTNVVKHFRHEQRGKKRLHKKPTRTQVMACRPWLLAELERVDPAVIVCLGASAAQALLGPEIRVMRDHGDPMEWEGYLVIPTIHPAVILRSVDAGKRVEMFDLLVADLVLAADLAAGRDQQPKNR